VNPKIFRWLLCVVVSICGIETLCAQGTAFTYQGRLNDGGNPANGNYDFQFSIYDSTNNPGTLIVGPLTNSAIAVANGLFTAQLDFGSDIFTGPDRWLQIAVRTNGVGGSFTNLFPRQHLTPAPYAIFANTASNLLGTLNAAQLSGALSSAQLSGTYSGAVAFTNGGNNFNGAFGGSFGGNGSSLSNLNASQLTNGTVADARLSANVAFLNGNQTFSGANVFTNFGNSFRGSFFGNGLVGWLAVTGTTVQATIDTGYVLTNSQAVTVTLPTNANVGDIIRISGAGATGWQIAQNAGQSVLGNFLSVGKSWTQSGSGAASWTSVASSSDGSKLFATIHGGNIYLSTDSGNSWSLIGPNSAQWQSIATSSDGTKVVAVIFGNGIQTSTNSGSTWTVNSSGGNENWNDVTSSSDGTKLAAVIYSGGIYTNSGTTWNASSASSKNWSSIASSADGSKLVATVFGGGIYTSANSGRTWSLAGGTSSANWQSVASSSDGTKLAAVISNSVSGGIYISTDSGATWNPTSAPAKNWSSIASSADGSKLVAAVFGGGIYTSGNWGATWTPQTSAPTTANWLAVASSSDGTELVAAINNSTTGGIYTSQVSSQTVTTTTSGYITGAQGSAVELQYIGNGQFMPVSSVGTIWAY
jgi:hypothetical protein